MWKHLAIPKLLALIIALIVGGTAGLSAVEDIWRAPGEFQCLGHPVGLAKYWKEREALHSVASCCMSNMKMNVWQVQVKIFHAV